MSQVINYYHFLISPFSYLGMKQFDAMVSKHNLTVNYLPIAPMQVFSETGGVPPAKRHPSRQRLRMDELKRWSAHLNVPMNLTPAHFPADQTLGAQMVLAAGGATGNPDAGKLVNALLTAVWAEEKNIADEDTLIACADGVGLSGSALLVSAKDDQWVKAYASTTETAIETGVMGSPTYQLGEDLFWGQDRLDFLERALVSS